MGRAVELHHVARSAPALAEPAGPVVLTCVADPGLLARLSDALRGRGVLRIAPTLTHLVAALEAAPSAFDIIVIPATLGPGDHIERSVPSIVRDMAGVAPHAAVVAYCRTAGSCGADIRGLAIAGVHEFLFAGDDSCIALRQVLDTARRECAAERVLAELTRVLPERVHPLAEACLSRPAEVRTVEDLANQVGLHRKTVFNQCVDSGLAGPSELIAWCRLALAGYLLHHTRRTVESVADQLEFPSVTALRNMLKRYTGLRANDVRSRGGTSAVVAALARRLARTMLEGGAGAELHVV